MLSSASVYAKLEDTPQDAVDSYPSNNLKTKIQGNCIQDVTLVYTIVYFEDFVIKINIVQMLMN